MTRFCTVLAPTDVIGELLAMGARLSVSGEQCALGILPDERAGGEAGAYYYPAQSLVAVGEVTLFNRAELLAELTPPPPATCSDGELLLRFYSQAGIAGFARVNGMFAFAIWDGKSLLLVRDAVGCRTLFYTRVGKYWAATSSLRALRRWRRLPIRLNLAAVRSFLTFAYLPGDETLFEGVVELLPGHCLRICKKGADDWQAMPLDNYWEPREQASSPTTAPEFYASHLRARLERATAMRLPANQKVGLFLSGGLDSSLVTALATKLHQQPVHTYSINFGADLPHELAYSNLVAAHCGTKHRILTFSGEQIAATLAETVALLDAPVGDPLTVPNLLLSRAAAADGLQVILNGEGGDPCFGGPKNLPMLLFEWHRTDPDPLVRARAYLRAYSKCYRQLSTLLTPAALDALQDAPPLERLVQPYLESEQMHSYINRLMYANTRLKGAHHILTKVERLTAACGLEGRSPLFDPAVVDYSFAIPPSLKLAATSEKWVLKLAGRDLLPALIIDRPKSGMRVPVQHWLHGPLKKMATDLLLGPQARARGLFRPKTIRTWMQGEGWLWPRQGTALWLLLTLELWLQLYFDSSESA